MANYLLNQSQQDYYNGDNFGGYQFASLNDIINQFMIIYVGEDKIIPKARRVDVAFHAQRAMQELSFDTFKSCKSQEITVPPSLQMTLPQDYVNYQKISWVDSAGIKHLLYPTSKTSNPTNPFQNSDGGFNIVTLADLTHNSDSIILDKQYDNILVGMVVKGVGIPNNTRVKSISTSNSITTITLTTEVVTPALGPITDATITFEPVGGELISEPDFQISQYNASYVAGESYITFYDGSQIDIAAIGVEIGMLISSEDFLEGTTVVNIDNNVVYVSNVAESSSGSYDKSIVFTSTNSESDTWSNYKSNTPSENNNNDYDSDDDIYDLNIGQRYGLDPQHAQVNGSFYIDCNAGKIHFSSNISGKTVVLDYLSDGLGTDEEMKVHKFAEEAMYKWITHAVLSSKANTPEYVVTRFKKERFAAIRTAKLRLSNIKLEEITQILRGKSKQIKH